MLKNQIRSLLKQDEQEIENIPLGISHHHWWHPGDPDTTRGEKVEVNWAALLMRPFLKALNAENELDTKRSSGILLWHRKREAYMMAVLNVLAENWHRLSAMQKKEYALSFLKTSTANKSVLQIFKLTKAFDDCVKVVQDDSCRNATYCLSKTRDNHKPNINQPVNGVHSVKTPLKTNDEECQVLERVLPEQAPVQSCSKAARPVIDPDGYMNSTTNTY